jgi:hypothetical protein
MDQLHTSLMLLMVGWTGKQSISPDDVVAVPLDVLDVTVDPDIAADMQARAEGRLRAGSADRQRYAEWLDHELRERHRGRLQVALVQPLNVPDLATCREIIEAYPNCCTMTRPTRFSPPWGR